MNIAIITPGGITNFGERAIMLGTVYALRAKHPRAKIAVFGYRNLPEDDPRLFKEMNQLGVTFYDPIIKGPNKLVKFFLVAGLFVAPRLFLPRRSYDYLRTASVYSKGQESFTQSYGLVHFIDSFLEQFLVSRITRKDIVMFGHSIGPIDNVKGFRKTCAFVVKKFDRIYVRDSQSKAVLLGLGYDPEKTEQIKDLAYAAVAQYDLGAPQKPGGHYLIVPNEAICRSPEQTEAYKNNLKQIAQNLLEEGHAVVVGSSVSAGGWNNDYKLCQWLKDELAGLELRYYHQLHEFLLDVKHAKKVVSSRLHPLIMATGLGTNVLALSQSPKVRGLLGDLKLQTAIIDPFEQHQKTELQKYL